MLFAFLQLRESVCMCVSGIRALGTACALISRSQTWGNMSARIQYQPFHSELMDCRVRELKNKPGWLRQEHPSHITFLSPTLSLGGGFEPVYSVCVGSYSKINKPHSIQYRRVVRVTSLSTPLFTNWQVNVLKATLIKKRAYNHFVYHNKLSKPLFLSEQQCWNYCKTHRVIDLTFNSCLTTLLAFSHIKTTRCISFIILHI